MIVTGLTGVNGDWCQNGDNKAKYGSDDVDQSCDRGDECQEPLLRTLKWNP